MTAIQLLACAGMIVGVFLLLEMKPVEFTDSLFGFLLNPKRSLREDIRESSGRKKSGILRRELKEAQNILQMTGRGNRFSFICAVALALFCAGNRFFGCSDSCHFVREFFPGSGDGSGFFISAILVCETDCQSL